MFIRRTLAHLLPRREEDPRFGEHLIRLGISGLRTLAIVELAVAVALFAARAAGANGGLLQAAGLAAIGLLTLLASRTPRTQRYPRAIGAVSAWAGPAILVLPAAGIEYTRVAILLVFVTAVASIPFLPWHAFAVGMANEFVYILSTRGELSSTAAQRDPDHILLILLALLATGIAASNYAHRRSEFQSQQEAVRVAETLTSAQLRAQLAESAISIGKMAAALSHEINSPLGALRSSVETLCAVNDRLLEAPPESRARFEQTRQDLLRSIEESAARIDQVTRRLRRFVNLEDSEVKSADINDLLADVSLLHRDEIERRSVRVEFDLEKSLPPLTCRPQLLTAAFSTLLSNAIEAVNGDGRIDITTRARDGGVEVTIRDNGRGMSPEEAETAFDPSFKVAQGRVASGNWSLFNSRQIVYEHGGDIRLETAPGRGTAVCVTLPVA
jgi:signal transduction histidine kinase